MRWCGKCTVLAQGITVPAGAVANAQFGRRSGATTTAQFGHCIAAGGARWIRDLDTAVRAA